MVNILYVSIATVFLAQLSKFVYGPLFQGKKINKKTLMKSGGMPSSHTALMVSLVVGLSLHGYYNEPSFAIAVCMSIIVIHDAMGVRLESGRQAKKINQILKEKKLDAKEQLKEELGHSAIEVLGGIVYGVIVPLIVFISK